MPVDFDENAFMARGHVDLNITVLIWCRWLQI